MLRRLSDDGGKEGELHDGDGPSAPGPQRSDLLGTLQEKFGPMPTVGPSKDDAPESKKRKIQPKKAGADDYDKFLSEMKDVLGPDMK